MAISGLGTGIGVTLTNDSADAYAQIISIGIVGARCDVIDVSSAASVDEYMDFLPGLLNSGELVMTLRYAGVMGATAPAEPEFIKDNYDGRTIETWTLTIPGGATGGTWVGEGFVSQIGIAVHYKGSVTQQCRIKCTGKWVYTVAS